MDIQEKELTKKVEKRAQKKRVKPSHSKSPENDESDTITRLNRLVEKEKSSNNNNQPSIEEHILECINYIKKYSEEWAIVPKEFVNEIENGEDIEGQLEEEIKALKEEIEHLKQKHDKELSDIQGKNILNKEEIENILNLLIEELEDF
jgi:hypothetical protein